MNLTTQKKTSAKILKTISNSKKMIKMARKREKRKIRIKIVKKRSSMMKNN